MKDGPAALDDALGHDTKEGGSPVYRNSSLTLSEWASGIGWLRGAFLIFAAVVPWTIGMVWLFKAAWL